jgi:hypothetical protein
MAAKNNIPHTCVMKNKAYHKPQSKQKTTPHNHTCVMKNKASFKSQISNLKSQIKKESCFGYQSAEENRRWWIPNLSL